MYYAGWQLIAEYDGAGALQRKYVYGPGIDEPVRMTLTASPLPLAYYFHADGLGSVTEISSAAGQLVERYRYDVYGTPTFQNASGAAIASSAIGNRLLFTARDRDPDTTWYNYRYRYYNPTLGRFPQPDPVGLAGRDVNLYRYVENNPSSLTDPLGLATYFAGMNLDYYGMFGGEGGAGYYVDTETPTKGTSFDMGFYSSGGGGVGWNTSAGFLTFGGVAGNRSAFTGEALNFSVGGPYVTGTIICDPNQKGNVFGFKPIGASITLGPGYPLLNVAASKTWTKAWSLYQWVDRKVEQFTKWIRR
jgi:RHS repeat-associated protein